MTVITSFSLTPLTLRSKRVSTISKRPTGPEHHQYYNIINSSFIIHTNHHYYTFFGPTGR